MELNLFSCVLSTLAFFLEKEKVGKMRRMKEREEKKLAKSFSRQEKESEEKR